jgi:hypothetical protein
MLADVIIEDAPDELSIDSVWEPSVSNPMKLIKKLADMLTYLGVHSLR